MNLSVKTSGAAHLVAAPLASQRTYNQTGGGTPTPGSTTATWSS